MSPSAAITNILNACLESVQHVVPNTFQAGRPTLVSAPIEQEALGVMIGITGELQGHVYLTGSMETFGKLGEIMFGMTLDPSMLQSFAGEFGNMIAGNMVRLTTDVKLDITPPAVMEGGTRVFGFQQAVKVPVISETVGTLDIALLLEPKQ